MLPLGIQQRANGTNHHHTWAAGERRSATGALTASLYCHTSQVTPVTRSSSPQPRTDQRKIAAPCALSAPATSGLPAGEAVTSVCGGFIQAHAITTAHNR